MSITDKSRKELWGKSANLCNICKKELFPTDKEKLNIGDECHIISSKIKGPRHKEGLSDYNLYSNLILLCKNHHKEIDELENTYTEELVRYIKTSHEIWVNQTLKKSLNKVKQADFLIRVTSGKELLGLLTSVHGFKTDYDDITSEEEADYIGSVFQELMDYGDIESMVEAYDRVKMGFQLSKLLKELEEKGYYLFANKSAEKVKISNKEYSDWIVTRLAIKKIDSEDIIKINMNEEL